MNSKEWSVNGCNDSPELNVVTGDGEKDSAGAFHSILTKNWVWP